MKLALIALLFLCGCAAKSGHVDETEKMNFVFFKHLSKDKPELQTLVKKYGIHVEEGSGIDITLPIPVITTGLNAIYPGLGALLTFGISLYARKKHLETAYVTHVGVKAAKETDPETALAILSNDPKVVHYNG